MWFSGLFVEDGTAPTCARWSEVGWGLDVWSQGQHVCSIVHGTTCQPA